MARRAATEERERAGGNRADDVSCHDPCRAFPGLLAHTQDTRRSLARSTIDRRPHGLLLINRSRHCRRSPLPANKCEGKHPIAQRLRWVVSTAVGRRRMASPPRRRPLGATVGLRDRVWARSSPFFWTRPRPRFSVLVHASGVRCGRFSRQLGRQMAPAWKGARGAKCNCPTPTCMTPLA